MNRSGIHQTRPVDLQALRVFVATAQDCNMSKAAERLGITQSAVSQTVRLLEKNLGTALLNRGGRPLTLTPAGTALFTKASALLEEALNLRGAVIEASRGIKPSLRIGLIDSFASACGCQLMRQLLPSTAHLSMRTGLTFNLGKALARREFDLAISSRLIDVEGVSNYPLLSERFLVIAPPESHPVCRRLFDLEALARVLPFIRFNQQSHLGQQVERALRRLNFTPQHRVEVDTAETLTQIVSEGMGWAVTTPTCLLQAARAASLVRLDVVHELDAGRTIYLHSRPGEYGSLAKQTFEMITEILRSRTAAHLSAITPELTEFIQINTWETSG